MAVPASDCCTRHYFVPDPESLEQPSRPVLAACDEPGCPGHIVGSGSMCHGLRGPSPVRADMGMARWPIARLRHAAAGQPALVADGRPVYQPQPAQGQRPYVSLVSIAFNMGRTVR